MKKLSLVSLLALCLSLPLAAAAAVPGTLAFSARIADAGAPVTGNHTVKFTFWDCDGTDPVTCVDPTNVLWTETQTLTVTDGVLPAVLGADSANMLPTAIFNGLPLFLEVTFDGTAFSPRMPVHSVPYAFRAATADTLGSLSPGQVALAGHAHPLQTTVVGFSRTIAAATCDHFVDGNSCPAGYQATGGGCTTFANNTPITNQFLLSNAMRCGWCNNNAFAVSGTVYTFCVRTAP